MAIHEVLYSVGDLMVSDSPLYVSVGFGSIYEQIKGHLFDSCRSEFNDADIVIGNLETVVHTPIRKNLRELQMACDETVVKEIRDAGFSVLNIANNHCMQHGTDGFINTIKTCTNNGMICVGEKNKEPIIRKVLDGLNFYFLSICLYTEFYRPEDVMYEDDIQKIIRDIKKIRENDDNGVIVLSIHWGDEFATHPSPTQVKLAHILVDCGTDIILGHHSHTFQGIEKYRGSLILYSQGNFISDMVPELCRDTGVVRIDISYENGKKDISYSFSPYHINDNCIPVQSKGDWFEIRQSELNKVIDCEISDGEYRNMVSINHKTCHDTFRHRFIHGVKDYNKMIYIQMLQAFIERKIKKKTGTYPKRFDLDKTLELAKKSL